MPTTPTLLGLGDVIDEYCGLTDGLRRLAQQNLMPWRPIHLLPEVQEAQQRLHELRLLLNTVTLGSTTDG